MDSSYLVNPLVYLVQTLFDLYIGAVMLRFILQWMQADSRNPISQFLIKITHPPLRLFRRFIPAIGRVDTASLLLLLVLQIAEGLIVSALQSQAIQPGVVAAIAVAQLLELALNIFFYATLLRAILSWFPSAGYQPVGNVLYALTEPLLDKVRSILPDLGGIDLSPLVVMIGIHFLKQALIPPVMHGLVLAAKLLG